MDTALDGVQGDGVVRRIRCEDGDGCALGQGINGGLVGFWIGRIVVGEGLEGHVEPVVGVGDVRLEVLTDRGILLARHANHGQVAHLAAAAEVEQRQANDADLLVRLRGTAADEAGGVLAGTDLDALEDANWVGHGESRTMRTSGGAMMVK